MKVRMEDMRPVFHNANKALIGTVFDRIDGNGKPLVDHKTLWEQEYNVKIIQGPWGEWYEIEFASAEDYTAFALRWA